VKRVVRPAEPSALTAFRDAHPDGTWDDARAERVNEPVFDALAAAQGGLCAYCEIDIRRPGYGQVEHVRAKSASTTAHNLHLDFANLLAACEGGARPDLDTSVQKRTLPPLEATRHCGQLKEDLDPTDRMLDPSCDVPPFPSLWTITFDGAIRVDEVRCRDAGVDVEVARRTIETLGLDRAGLRIQRRAVIVELDAHLRDDEVAGDDDALMSGLRRVAEAQLLPDRGRLQPFWSTIRSWGGSAVEPFLREHADEIPGLGER
jgi:uncharacterized protein (TIGR02646 family)